MDPTIYLEWSSSGPESTGGGSRRLALVCIGEPLPGKKFVLDRRVHPIGRSKTCQIVINDPSVSRDHAVIEVDKSGAVMLRDLDSTNGTRVNGKRIDGSVRLFASALVEFGTVRFRCIGDEEAALHDAVLHAIATDAATGLPNRQEFHRLAGETLAASQRKSIEIGIAFLEFENYSAIAGRFGHVAAEQAAEQIAKRVVPALRTQEVASRYFDDVFAFVLKDADGEGGARRLEGMRREILSHRFRHDGQDLDVSVRTYLERSSSRSNSEELIDRCLQAMSRGRRAEEAIQPEAEVPASSLLETRISPLPMSLGESIRALASFGCRRQAERLACDGERGRRRNELLNLIDRSRQAVPANSILGMLYHEPTGAGVPFAPGLRMPSGEHSASVATQVIASFERAIGLSWSFLLHGAKRSPPWRPTIAEAALRLLNRSSGDSLELAFALDAMSVWCGIRPASPIVATGRLSETGAVLSVLHVREKLLGVSEEFAGHAILFLVPQASDLEGTATILESRGHRVAFVTGLEDARRHAFGDRPLGLQPEPSVLLAVVNALDALLDEGDPARALRLIEHLELQALRGQSELEWARIESRRGMAFAAQSEWSRASTCFDEALPLVEHHVHQLSREQQARHESARIQSFLARCILGENDSSRSALVDCLHKNHFGELVLTPRERSEIRSTLAALNSRTGNHAAAIAYRKENLDESLLDDPVPSSAADDWTKLVWEASRGQDTKCAEEAWKMAMGSARTIREWTSAGYARIRQLESEGRTEEILDLIDVPERFAPAPEAYSAWVRVLNTREEFGYPGCAARRVLGRALAVHGRDQEARQFLEASFHEMSASEDALLAWHAELARLELALLDARLNPSRAAEVRGHAIRGLESIHPPSAVAYRDLLEAARRPELTGNQDELRAAIRRVYL